MGEPEVTYNCLTHWGRVTNKCVSYQAIIGSDNGLSPCRRQAIIWTNVEILLIGPLGTNFSEILIEIHTFSFNKMHWKMSSGKCRPFCLAFNVLNQCSAAAVFVDSIKERRVSFILWTLYDLWKNIINTKYATWFHVTETVILNDVIW